MTQSAGGAEIPDLVPARMVNEFTYCPRLFYLEWVQGRFVDNDDTVEGRWVHRVVDEGGGAAPLPDNGRLIAARSVQLSSTELGVAAKADLIEGHGGAVVPVDTKRGTPPNNPERSWEPERIQLCIQGLLLREAGYRCDEGVLYFAEARERVVVPFDDALVARTHEVLEQLRTIATCERAPAPLVDSPKCPRCSLVGLCLPDETNLLVGRARKPRRLIPSADAARPLYVTQPGAYVGKKAQRIEVSLERQVISSHRLIDVSQVCLLGNAQISSQLVRDLLQRDTPICWFTSGGWFTGMATGLPSKHVELRRRQVLAADADNGLSLARIVVAGKIRNTRTLLMRNGRPRADAALRQLKDLAETAAGAGSISSLLGVEGAAARIYFDHFLSMLRAPARLPGEPFSFDGRNRRPPKDPINALLSFCYALLTKDLTATLTTVGFDPYLGFFHRPRFGRPALALDLAEEFRPTIAESVVITTVNNGEVKSSDFVTRAGGVALTPDGRRAILAAYERRLGHEVRHPLFGYTITYRRMLEVQARLLGAYLLGEIPAYEPFRTR